MRKHIPRCPAPPLGVGLLEVLVSILVISIGLLGAAALQAGALRNNQGSYERGQATLLTQALVDAMRANRVAALNGNYNLNWACLPPGGATLAQQDLDAWIRMLQRQINGSACGMVQCVAAPGNVAQCTVGIQWDVSRNVGAGAGERQTVQVAASL